MSDPKSAEWINTIHDAQSHKHQKEVSDFKKERKMFLDAIGERDTQIETLLDLVAHEPQPVKIQVGTPSEDGEATMVAVASDWHVEENVDPRTVNGLNSFNLAIAEKRIQAFWRNVVKITETQRHSCKIDRLMLVFGGDFMSGFIHDELKETNELSPTETVLWLMDQLTGGIDFLSKHFNELVIPCCYGNHGRNTIKPRHATGAANSYEWMMYHILKRHVGGKADFHITDGYHLLMDLYGKTIRIHHGDGLKYQGGIGGLTIPVEKAIASWNKGIRADLDIFGHWHQSQQNPKWICNSSLIGYNAYAMSIKAPYEEPSQTAFLFDKKRGRTGTFPVFLD